MLLVSRAFLVGVLMLFCLVRNIRAQLQLRNMSSLAGQYSVAYVTVPDDTVAKKIAR
jgi:hypothetical protein